MLTDIPSELIVSVTQYLTGLEFLRFNIVTSFIHNFTSTPVLNSKWVGYLQLSDRIRRANYSKTAIKKYSNSIGRTQALAALKLRCQYCRVQTKYANEFALQQHCRKVRVCEKCEVQRRNTTFALLTAKQVSHHGLSREAMSSIPSITRGAGREMMRLYLKSDVDTLVQDLRRKVGRDTAGDDSDSDSDSGETQWGRGRRRNHGRRSAAPSACVKWSNPSSHSRRSKHSSSRARVAVEEMYELSLSTSCLVLHTESWFRSFAVHTRYLPSH